jgi:hypothetical protein
MKRWTIPSAIVAALLTCFLALGTDAAARIYETGLSLAGGTLSGSLTLPSTGTLSYGTRGSLRFTADGKAQLLDTAGTAFDMLIFGPATSAGAALQRSGSALVVRNGDSSANGNLVASQVQGTFNLYSSGTADSALHVTGTGGGARLGTTGKYGWSDGTSGAAGTTDTYLSRAAAGVVGVNSAHQYAEISEPSAPAANGAVLFAQDNGSGKTQLCVRFATGAAQCFATEP